MTYATQADMLVRFGEPELIQLTDRFDAPLGLIDPDVLGQALARADGEIDSYIAARVSLPLAAVFLVLTVRAWIVPRFSFSPKQIGIAEIASTLAVALVSLFTVG